MPNPVLHATETPGRDAGETLQGTDKLLIAAFSRTEMSIEDQELARRYLAGSLTEEERAMFEERILADPAFLDEVRQTEAMRDGLRHLESHGQLAPLLTPVPRFWANPAFALAASIAALAFAITSTLLYLRIDQSHEDFGVVATNASGLVVDTLRFELTRSATAIPNVTWNQPDVPTMLELEFDVGLEPAASYRATIALVLKDITAPVLVLPNLFAEADGLIVVAINSSLLQRGDYRIRLEPQSEPSVRVEPLDYSLRILD